MWLIYAIGGGWGHLTRACALARAHPARILANSPHIGEVRGFEIERIETPEQVVPAIRAAAPECLIVDTFPRGLRGELAGALESIAACKVLVHRDLNPRYVEARDLRRFVASAYDLVLTPGAGEGSAFGDLPQAVTTAPWLIRSAHEIQRSGEPFVYVCAAGRPEEAQWYAAVGEGLRAAGVRVCEDRHWPAMELYGGAAAVVGGGGYNTVHECVALGVPLVARAWPRKYDRQGPRLRRYGFDPVDRVEEAVERAVALWRRGPERREAPDFGNGVDEAAECIETSIRHFAQSTDKKT